MGRYLALSAIVLSAAAAGAWLMTRAGVQTETPPESFDIVRGKTHYAEYCAACHGADLEGQPDWRSPGPDGVLPAPPHDETGHTWHHPDSVLYDYTKLGGKAALSRQGVDFESGMPSFDEQLSDAEIRDIIAYIKSTWPERLRAIQAERSAQEQ